MLRMPTIRPATLADIPLLVELRTEFLTELRARAHSRSITSPLNLQASTAEYYARAIPSGQYAGWIAEEQGQPVGTAGCYFAERPPMERPGPALEGRVVNVYTRPAWRRRGIGAALVLAAITHARQLGARRLRLGAAPDGRGVYERLGFQPIANEMELRLVMAEEPAGAGRPDETTSPGGQ